MAPARFIFRGCQTCAGCLYWEDDRYLCLACGRCFVPHRARLLDDRIAGTIIRADILAEREREQAAINAELKKDRALHLALGLRV